MELKQLKETWDNLGKWDPLWAILTRDDKTNRRWKPDEFFKTGEDEIADVLRQVDRLIPGPPRRKALDFGCGVGRLTQAMCSYFEKCHGVDIAASMIKLARTYNRHGERCQYHVNASADLRIFPDNVFDFIYSNIVLQHMKQEFSKTYIKEFLRTLTPGGMIVFQLPSAPTETLAVGNTPMRNEPLPPDGFVAQITGPDSLCCKPRSALNVQVKVKNASSTTWPCRGSGADRCGMVRLGNHWLDHKGRMKILDDGRAGLPDDLKPGDEVELSLMVVAPGTSGMFQLELDMLQEGVAWFADRGSKSCRIPVRCTHRTSEMLAGFWARTKQRYGWRHNSPEHFPRMEMHGIAKEDIVRFIAAHGGKTLRVDEMDCLDADWISNVYFVTK